MNLIPTTISGRGNAIRNLPESLLSLSGDFAITEVRFEGIGSDGLGLPCMAARACCTASCRTSASKTENGWWETSNQNRVCVDCEWDSQNECVTGHGRPQTWRRGIASRERKQDTITRDYCDCTHWWKLRTMCMRWSRWWPVTINRTPFNGTRSAGTTGFCGRLRERVCSVPPDDYFYATPPPWKLRTRITTAVGSLYRAPPSGHYCSLITWSRHWSAPQDHNFLHNI